MYRLRVARFHSLAPVHASLLWSCELESYVTVNDGACCCLIKAKGSKSWQLQEAAASSSKEAHSNRFMLLIELAWTSTYFSSN
jgi:hypothetical protein